MFVDIHLYAILLVLLTLTAMIAAVYFVIRTFVTLERRLEQRLENHHAKQMETPIY